MFRFGLLTAILDGWTFEEAVDIAAEMGFECLEVACWPAGKADRRYAGVSHIDVDNTSPQYIAYVQNYCKEKGIEIILDGVFNHTGSDSIYFNRYGRYKELGAYQSKGSKYYDWFEFWANIQNDLIVYTDQESKKYVEDIRIKKYGRKNTKIIVIDDYTTIDVEFYESIKKATENDLNKKFHIYENNPESFPQKPWAYWKQPPV